jgi:hypothetical protein
LGKEGLKRFHLVEVQGVEADKFHADFTIAEAWLGHVEHLAEIAVGVLKELFYFHLEDDRSVVTSVDVVHALVCLRLDIQRPINFIKNPISIGRSLVLFINIAIRIRGHLVAGVKFDVHFAIVGEQALCHGQFKLVVGWDHTDCIRVDVRIIQILESGHQSVV